MPSGTITVDIDKLTALVGTLSSIKSDLDGQLATFNGLSGQLDAAITGTASSIGTYETAFQTWTGTLASMVGDVDSAYTALNQVLSDANDAVNHAL